MLSPLGIPDGIIQPFVGSLAALAEQNPGRYVKKMKALKPFIINLCAGQLNKLDPEVIQELRLHWPIQENDQEVSALDWEGNTYFPTVYIDDPVLKRIVGLDPRDEQNLFSLAGLCKLDSLVTDETITRSDRVDFFNVVTKEFTPNEQFLNDIIPEIEKIVDDICHHSTSLLPYEVDRIPFYGYPANPNKRSLCVDDEGNTFMQTRNHLAPFNIAPWFRYRPVLELYQQYPDEFVAALITGVPVKDAKLDLSEVITSDDQILDYLVASRLTQRPQSGLKRRGIAMPGILINSLLEPAASKVTHLLRHSCIQGMFDHAKVCEDISKLLEAYKGTINFESIDSKNFTDRLPYKGCQRVVLERLVYNGFLSDFDLAAMDMVCFAKHEFPVRPKQYGLVSYGVGTAQGTRLSFPLCSLTNEILLRVATNWAYKRMVSPRHVAGRVVGDDIVIYDRDPRVAAIYRSILGNYGVQISESKSISSRFIAEMCSKLITPNGVYRQKRINPLDPKYLESMEDVLNSHRDEMLYWKERLLYVHPEWMPLKLALEKYPEPYGLGTPISDPLDYQADTMEKKIALIFHIHNLANKYKTTRPNRPDVITLLARQQFCPPTECRIDRNTEFSAIPKQLLENCFLDSERLIWDTYISISRENLTLEEKASKLDALLADYTDLLKAAVTLNLVDKNQPGIKLSLVPRKSKELFVQMFVELDRQNTHERGLSE